MRSAVLDTNVLASGFTVAGGIPDRLLRAWLAGSFALVVLEPILTELTRTFQKPYFRTRLSATQIAQNLALQRSRARVTPLTAHVAGVASHPEDDLVLAAALSTRADYLVTGDRKLQDLQSYQGVAILSPRAFLDALTP